jgi:DNA modification methylase
MTWSFDWPGKSGLTGVEALPLVRTDHFPAAPGGEALHPAPCRLIRGDNLGVALALMPEFAGKVDLIYLDPPFLAGEQFVARLPVGSSPGRNEGRDRTCEAPAFDDRWPGGVAAYLQMLYPRLLAARELLTSDGSIIVHVNWRVGHLVQMLMDEIFGPGERYRSGSPGFRAEIVWGFGGGGAPKKQYRRKHDNLFWYTRGRRWTFNTEYRPYSPKTLQRGLTEIKGPAYRLRDEGASLETWWTDGEVQKVLSPSARENWKYPTQKPETLLERVIRIHSRPGDLVADLFCGSGTTGVAAQKLHRRWLLVDESPVALSIATRRIALAGRDGPPDSASGSGFDRWTIAGCVHHTEGDDAPALWPTPLAVSDASGFEVSLQPGCSGQPSALERIEAWSIDWAPGAVLDANGRPVFVHRGWEARAPGRRQLTFRLPIGPSQPPGNSALARAWLLDVSGAERILPVLMEQRSQGGSDPG